MRYVITASLLISVVTACIPLPSKTPDQSEQTDASPGEESTLNQPIDLQLANSLEAALKAKGVQADGFANAYARANTSPVYLTDQSDETSQAARVFQFATKEFFKTPAAIAAVLGEVEVVAQHIKDPSTVNQVFLVALSSVATNPAINSAPELISEVVKSASALWVERKPITQDSEVKNNLNQFFAAVTTEEFRKTGVRTSEAVSIFVDRYAAAGIPVETTYTASLSAIVKDSSADSEVSDLAQLAWTIGAKDPSIRQRLDAAIAEIAPIFEAKNIAIQRDFEHCPNMTSGDTVTRVRFKFGKVSQGSVCESEKQSASCNNGVLAWKGTFKFSECQPCASSEDLVDGACVQRSITAMKNEQDCYQFGGFWYDQRDVSLTSPNEFSSLTPSCHLAPDVACPLTGNLHIAKDSTGAFFDVSIENDQPYLGLSSLDLAEVYTSIRCLKDLSTIGANDLTVQSLDFRLNPKLESLEVQSTTLSQLKVPSSVVYLDLYNTTIDPNAVNLKPLTKLATLKVPPGLKSIEDISRNVVELTINQASNLGAVDLRSFKNMTLFDCYGCGITTINLSGVPLQVLRLTYNQLTNISLTGLAALRTLEVASNQLTTINLAGLGLLSSLNLSHNTITSLDLSQQTELVSLYVTGNQLSNLNVAMLTKLQTLSAAKTNLNSISLVNLPDLRWLFLADNHLSTLDLSQNTKLFWLDVQNNNLTYDGNSTVFNLSAATNLQIIKLTGNPNLVFKIAFGQTLQIPMDGGQMRQYIYATSTQWATFTGANKSSFSYVAPSGGQPEHYRNPNF